MRFELFKLVLRFVTNQIDYRTFRELMMGQFLSRRSQDAALDAMVARIDVVCADFSQGLIAPEELGKYILVAVQASAPGAHVGSGSNVLVGQLPQPPRAVTSAMESSFVLTAAA
jgi:hypothetical protein